jgi:hypothetical protein
MPQGLLRASAFLFFWVAACGQASSANGGGSDGGHTCALGFLGTDGKPVEMKLVVRGRDQTSSEISDGARVPLMLPPQGGRVVFVGVKATNISSCGLTLTGSFRDLANNQVRLDGRTINLHPTGDGWGSSLDADMSSFANIPMCPNQWASTDVFEHSFELTVTLSDAAGRTGTKTIQTVAFCGEPEFEAECRCECKKGYVLGQACP